MSSDEDEIDLAELDATSPSRRGQAASAQRGDDEIHSPSLRAPYGAMRSPISSNPGNGHIQLTTLYSGVHNEKEREESFTAAFGGAADPEVMDDPVSRYGRGSGALYEDDEEEQLREEQRYENEHKPACPCLQGEHATHGRLLLCCLVLIAIWIPVIVLWARGDFFGSPEPGPAVPAASYNHSSTLVSGTPAVWETTPADTIVAYVGDVALNADTKALYTLIKNEGAAAMVIAGDLDYENAPDRFDEQITEQIDSIFPVFAVAGNHDLAAWGGYSRVLAARWERAGVSSSCRGLAGEAAVCAFRGIGIVQATPGIFAPADTAEGDAAPFVKQALKQYFNSTRWVVCSWHKNQRNLQTGSRDDETGNAVYEACRAAGAMVATGHEHSYARSYLLSRMSDEPVRAAEPANNASYIPLAPGASLVFCQGMGGHSINPNEVCYTAAQDAAMAAGEKLLYNQTVNEYGEFKQSCPWFASMENSDTGATVSALFCRYNSGGDINRADCYMKGIDEIVRDRFTLDASAMPQTPPEKPADDAAATSASTTARRLLKLRG